VSKQQKEKWRCPCELPWVSLIQGLLIILFSIGPILILATEGLMPFLFWATIVIIISVFLANFWARCKEFRCSKKGCACICHQRRWCNCRCHYWCDDEREVELGEAAAAATENVYNKGVCSQCRWHNELSLRECPCKCHRKHSIKSVAVAISCRCPCHKWCTSVEFRREPLWAKIRSRVMNFLIRR